MSNAALNHVWRNSGAKGSALLVMIAIADMANDEGDCWPGRTNLAKKCRMSKRNLQAITAKLADLGELEILQHEGVPTSTGKTNRYRVIGVNQASPLDSEGVKNSSPLKSKGVNQASPPGVNQASPDPSLEPLDIEQPSEKDSADTRPGSDQPAPLEPLCAPDGAPDGREPECAVVEKKPTPHQEMFQAICDALELNPDYLTKDRSSTIGKTATAIRKAKGLPEHIPGYMAWLQQQAEAQDWSALTEHAMRKYWGDYASKVLFKPSPTSNESPDPFFNPIFRDMTIAEQMAYKREQSLEMMERLARGES